MEGRETVLQMSGYNIHLTVTYLIVWNNHRLKSKKLPEIFFKASN